MCHTPFPWDASFNSLEGFSGSFGGSKLNVTFYGVRGSTPCGCASNQRVGGNTACVLIEVPGETPLLCDVGTGLRFFGTDWINATAEPINATALVSHLHWDHVQGLPFFIPLHREGARLHIVAPRQDVGLVEAFDTFMAPPYFPIRLGDLAGEVTFEEATVEPMKFGSLEVTARSVPHIGPTLGFRIDSGSGVVTYIPDHQQPQDGSMRIADTVLELAAGADLLIHDAQFTPEEFALRSDWGHCTIEYAYEIAKRAEVQTLALFHHDPSHTDDMMDQIMADLTQRSQNEGGPRVVCAYEGLRVSVGAVGVRASISP